MSKKINLTATVLTATVLTESERLNLARQINKDNFNYRVAMISSELICEPEPDRPTPDCREDTDP